MPTITNPGVISATEKPLTAKHDLFIDNLFECAFNATEAYRRTYPDGAEHALHNATRLMGNDGIIAEIARRRASIAEKADYSREDQLDKLKLSYGVALAEKSSTGMTGAVRAQNAMLGYDQEKAPNELSQRDTRLRMDAEDLRIARIVADQLCRIEGLERPILETGAKYTESEVIDAHGPS